MTRRHRRDKGKDTERKARKERVIHTRVPEELDSQLKDKAEGLGISVSKLIRNVLSNTFDLVDDIVVDSADIARSGKRALHDAAAAQEPTANPALPAPVPAPETADANTIIGWQPLVLNLNAICNQCNAILAKGTAAHLGIHNPPAAHPTILCNSCIKEIQHEPEHTDDSEH